jgi:hypothetical protein
MLTTISSSPGDGMKVRRLMVGVVQVTFEDRQCRHGLKIYNEAVALHQIIDVPARQSVPGPLRWWRKGAFVTS